MTARVNTGPRRLSAPCMLQLRLQKGSSFRCLLSSALFELDSESRPNPGEGGRLRAGRRTGAIQDALRSQTWALTRGGKINPGDGPGSQLRAECLYTDK